MKSTSVRLNSETVDAMRIASTELAASLNLFFSSDDERVNALVAHVHATKSRNHPPAEQDSAGVSTPSPRQDSKRNPQMPA